MAETEDLLSTVDRRTKELIRALGEDESSFPMVFEAEGLLGSIKDFGATIGTDLRNELRGSRPPSTGRGCEEISLILSEDLRLLASHLHGNPISKRLLGSAEKFLSFSGGPLSVLASKIGTAAERGALLAREAKGPTLEAVPNLPSTYPSQIPVLLDNVAEALEALAIAISRVHAPRTPLPSRKVSEEDLMGRLWRVLALAKASKESCKELCAALETENSSGDLKVLKVIAKHVPCNDLRVQVDFWERNRSSATSWLRPSPRTPYETPKVMRLSLDELLGY